DQLFDHVLTTRGLVRRQRVKLHALLDIVGGDRRAVHDHGDVLSEGGQRKEHGRQNRRNRKAARDHPTGHPTGRRFEYHVSHQSAHRAHRIKRARASPAPVACAVFSHLRPGTDSLADPRCSRGWWQDCCLFMRHPAALARGWVQGAYWPPPVPPIVRRLICNVTVMLAWTWTLKVKSPI